MSTGLLSRFVRACTVLVVLVPVVVVPASSASAAAPDVSITFSRQATGLVQPVHVASPFDGTGRLFVVEKAGRIRVVSGGRLLATPYLDIRSLVKDAGEGGLFSIAFHPHWRTQPYFWVNYVTNAGDIRVARFKAPSYTSNSVSASTQVKIIDVWHPDKYTNHYGGQVVFGHDGYLYVSTGDGGSGDDPGNRAQDTRFMLGKMLRLQVIGCPIYCIPPTNPYARSTTAKRQIWAIGLRNPWRFSFDAATHDLWIGDVGQGRQEEVDHIRAGAGGKNLGWSCREGTLVHIASRCRSGTTYTSPRWSTAAASGRRSPVASSTAARPTAASSAAATSARTSDRGGSSTAATSESAGRWTASRASARARGGSCGRSPSTAASTGWRPGRSDSSGEKGAESPRSRSIASTRV